MPIIKRNSALVEEGEYVAQARNVTQEVTKKGVTIFRVPLHLPDGRTITTVIRVTDQTAWVFDQLCKSGNISLPEGGEDFQINCDDLEKRVFFFAVVHNIGSDGVKYQNVKFHAKSWAVQQNPELASVSFPMAAPPITLRAVSPPPEEPSTETGPASAKAVPPPIAPAPAEAKPFPFDEELGGITPEEFAQAVEAARAAKRKKQEAAAA
jgi:hypothetical protein